MAAEVDHVAFTVPDLDEAARFFVAVLGAEELYRREHEAPAGSDEMVERFNAHRSASYRLAKLRLGRLLVELFEYRAPDLATVVPRGCDAGGHHLGLVVADLEQAVAAVAAVPGTRVLGPVSEMEGGRRWVYLLTPWGLQLELATGEAA